MPDAPDDTPIHLRKTSFGLEVCYAAPFAYVLVWLSGLALLFVEKEDAYVRFHAAQSVALFAPLTLLSAFLGAIPLVGWLLAPVVGLVAVALWALSIYRAWEDSRSGVPLRLPVVAELADALLARWSA